VWGRIRSKKLPLGLKATRWKPTRICASIIAAAVARAVLHYDQAAQQEATLRNSGYLPGATQSSRTCANSRFCE